MLNCLGFTSPPMPVSPRTRLLGSLSLARVDAVLLRFGTPGPTVIEVEGPEKGLAARAAGSSYVVVCGGVSNLGKISLPPVVRSVVIARDADPAGSLADQALWCGACAVSARASRAPSPRGRMTSRRRMRRRSRILMTSSVTTPNSCPSCLTAPILSTGG